MKQRKHLNLRRRLRANRTRARIFGGTVNVSRPRLSVFRSNKFIYAQIINDSTHETLAAGSTRELLIDEKGNKLSKVRAAEELGRALAKKAKDKNIDAVVFDKGSYRYHGRVKAVAEGARQGGLKL